MNDSNAKRDVLLGKMAGYILASGLAGASLRPLAKAAGTSDRMLIYHFGSKERLIGELLHHLAAQLTEAMETALPKTRAASRAECASEIVAFLRQSDVAAFAHVWFDILAEAKRGNPVFRQTSGQIMDGFLVWVETRLPENDPDPQAGAAKLLTFIEGVLVLDAAGRPDIADRTIATLD